MEKNIQLIYSYDGSEFFGFQRQVNCRTVQGELEKALNIIFKQKINLVSAGRTDRGVHAKKQVSNFQTNSKIPTEKIKKILNSMLPKDILILDVIERDENFNSRFSATYRAYEYYITKNISPFNSRYATYIKDELDITKLNEIVSPLIGKHDFVNFKLSDCTIKTTIREIYEAKFLRVDSETIKLYVKGNAFLKSQIRIIVGTVLDIYFKEKPENLLIEMLHNVECEYIKKVAEPNGLFLSDIGYEEEI